MMQRRGFLAAILAAGAAPAIARSGVLMPLGRVWVPDYHLMVAEAMKKMELQMVEMAAFPPMVYCNWKDMTVVAQGQFVQMFPRGPIYPQPGLHHGR